ncbi:type II secretion system GspH family protein [Patescibacteria group bacterium]|nr:type II secretion system GspH family protein [Patescibacteria group bacterium]
MKFKNKGFTLIELLVVISIIGIITTLISANLNAARERGRDAQRKSDLYNIRTGLRLYYNDKMGFPGNNSSGQILGCGTGGTTACEWTEEWTSGSTTYMVVLPNDPLDGQSYKYQVETDNESFTLSSCLENKSDDKGVITDDVSWCSTGWMYQIIQ